MLGQLTGLRIIESASCYETKIVVRGIADKRRPNSKKPLYRRVAVRIPRMYRVGNDIICHPSFVPRIRQAFQQSRAADVATVSPQNDLAAQWKEWAFNAGLR